MADHDAAVPAQTALGPLARTVEALLFLSPEPVPAAELVAAAQCSAEELEAALSELAAELVPERRGLVLRELAGGWTLVSAPETEEAARRLLAKPRTPPLSPAQAETLAIVAYLQPVSRPEITRIRGVSAESAAGTLLERGLIEESGRSQFGAVLYRTTPLFLKLFGLTGIADLPDPSAWDPTPDEESELRERLLQAGDLRSGTAPVPQPGLGDGHEDHLLETAAPGADEEPAPRSGDGEPEGISAPTA